MKLEVIVRLQDGVQVFRANTTAQAQQISARFRAQGIQAVIAPVYPDRDEYEE